MLREPVEKNSFFALFVLANANVGTRMRISLLEITPRLECLVFLVPQRWVGCHS